MLSFIIKQVQRVPPRDPVSILTNLWFECIYEARGYIGNI